MLRPEDIMNQRFEKVSKGYRMEEVDDFLDKVVADYAKLQEANIDLERKLEVVADKLEEYRQSEESLKTVLVGAQKLGDSIVREAKAKSEVMMQEATAKAAGIVSEAEAKASTMLSEAQKTADDMLGDTKAELKREQETLAALNKEVSEFKNNLLEMYREHLELISKLTDDEEVEEEEAVEDEDVEVAEEAEVSEEDADELEIE